MTVAVMLRDLLAGIVEVPASVDSEVRNVCIDSRHCTPGSVFLACAGISSHGLDYLDQALRLGAETVLWEPNQERNDIRFPEDAITLKVEQLSRHVGTIAARMHGNPSEHMPVIGVTGTNGKTSVAHLSAQALTLLGMRSALFGTLGYGFPENLQEASHTTPDAVRLQQMLAAVLEDGAAAVAMEVSSHALDQHRVDGVHFRTAVFTNLTHEHLDYHGDIGRYAEAKRRLFDWPGLKNAVINIDDAVGVDFLRGLDSDVRSYAVSLDAERIQDIAADHRVWADGVEYGDAGLTIRLVIDGEARTLNSPLLGRFNAANLLSVAAVLLSLGFDGDSVVRALSSVKPVAGRMQRLGGGGQPMVIVDYAHTPDALMQVLSAAREHTAGSLVCVFGCGGDRDRSKRPEMGRIAERLADRIVITDDNPRTEDGDEIVKEILVGVRAPDAATVERDRAAAIRLAMAGAEEGDTVVIAGKGHEDYQIVGNERRRFSDVETAAALLAGESRA